jgi:hypothetical protein
MGSPAQSNQHSRASDWPIYSHTMSTTKTITQVQHVFFFFLVINYVREQIVEQSREFSRSKIVKPLRYNTEKPETDRQAHSQVLLDLKWWCVAATNQKGRVEGEGKLCGFHGCLDFGTVHMILKNPLGRVYALYSIIDSAHIYYYRVGDPFSRVDHVPSLCAEVYLDLIYLNIGLFHMFTLFSQSECTDMVGWVSYPRHCPSLPWWKNDWRILQCLGPHE